MKLSVRLGEKEQKALRGLRRRKVNVSALVRKTIVEANDERRDSRSDLEILDDIIRRYPSPPRDELPKRPPLNDRKAMSEFIRRRLRRE